MQTDPFFTADILGDLRSMNFAITETSVSATGEYLVEDVLWNYQDARHTDVVHTGVMCNAPFFVTRNSLCTLLVMKNFGLPVPIVLVQYFKDPSALYTIQSLGFGFLLRSVIHMTQETETTTHITIDYHVISHRVLKWLHPIIVRMLKKNFERLLQEDEPMRLRKMELRRMGFVNTSPNRLTYLDTLNISQNNIRFDPAKSRAGAPAVEQVVPVPNGHATSCVKLDDEKQFRLVAQGGEVLVFGTVCPHEGADLSGARCENGRLVCPWHGRKVQPLARIPVGQHGEVRLDALHTTIAYTPDAIRFTPHERRVT